MGKKYVSLIKQLLLALGILLMFSINVEVMARNVVRISELNLPSDNHTDVSNEINELFARVAGKNYTIDFDCDFDYAIGSDTHYATLYVSSNTTIRFTGKGFLKLQGPSENGSVVLISGCNNVTIQNVQIYGGGAEIIRGSSGQNGIGIGNSSNVRIKGGIIKNCAKGKDVYLNGNHLLGDGGKGIQVENHGVDNCVIDGVTIMNCNKAISCHRDLSQEGPVNVVFKNIKAKDCDQFAIIHQTNGEDLIGNQQKVKIVNFYSENCGKDDGVFIFSRTRFLKIKGGTIVGDRKVPAIFRGRIGHSSITGVTIDQPCRSVVDMNPSDYGRDERETSDNSYIITVSSVYDYLISSDTNKRYPNREMLNSTFKCKAKEHPSTDLYTDQVVNSRSNYIIVKYEDGNKYVMR